MRRSRDRRTRWLATALLHELMQIKLGALTKLGRLCRGRTCRVLYALWRDDPDPLGGLIHGVYAFLGLTRFWHTSAGRRPDEAAARSAEQPGDPPPARNVARPTWSILDLLDLDEVTRRGSNESRDYTR